jgi:cyclase
LKSAPTRLSDSILVFDGNYPGGGNVTSAVFHSGKEAFVFDSLLYPDDTRALLKSMKDLGLGIRGLVNTHWHVDHTAGNQLFLETSRIISHSLCGGLMAEDDLTWLNEELKLEDKDKVRHSFPNESIADGSTLQVGSRMMEILHTPGHTPDSIVGWLKDEDVIVAGDTVTELPFAGYGDSRDLIESLQKVKSISGDRGKIIQGHGGICRGEKLDDDINYIEEVQRRTAEYVGSGETAEEASKNIKLEDCVTKERFQFLSKGFQSILWFHPENVKRVYKELKEKGA